MKLPVLKPLTASLGVALLLSTSCSKVDSNDLKEDIPYYQEYNLTYNKTDNKTEASAIFKVRESSGSRVELTGDANVKLNGIKGETSLTDKSKYSWELSGVNDATFVLTKNSGQTVSNTITVGNIGDVTIVNLPDSVSKSSGFSFEWSGPALANGESIRASIASTIGNVTLYGKDVSGNKVEFSSTELTVVPTGNIRITLSRKKEMPLQNADGNAGGIISAALEVKEETRLRD